MRTITTTYLMTALLLSVSTIGFAQHDKHDHAEAAIGLDQGNKWKVHDNMMTHISQMKGDVEAVAVNKDKDYEALNGKLVKGIDGLTNDCTMSGQAHDELHKWLLPFIGTVHEYKSEMMAEQKANWFEDVRRSMVVFEEYFE